MRRTPPPIWLALLALAVGLPAAAPAAQQVEDREKLAQTSLKFLSIAGDPRAAALASAATALEGGASMLFANPAGMAWMEADTDVSLSQTGWMFEIEHNHGAVAFQPAGGRFGVVGVSVAFADYGDFQETVRADNEQGFVDIGTFSPTAFTVGVGYARSVTDRFSVGGQVKYARMDFGTAIGAVGDGGPYTRESIAEGTLAYDFGVQYKTGFESLIFAVSTRNFAPEITFVEESSQLPLTFQIGLAMDVVDLTSLDPSVHSLRVSADATNPLDFNEQVRLGGEYTFANTLALRAGYPFPSDEEGFSLGAGVQQEISGLGFGADYSYTATEASAAVHRVAVRFSL